jgi:hypothetical protein
VDELRAFSADSRRSFEQKTVSFALTERVIVLTHGSAVIMRTLTAQKGDDVIWRLAAEFELGVVDARNESRRTSVWTRSS